MKKVFLSTVTNLVSDGLGMVVGRGGVNEQSHGCNPGQKERCGRWKGMREGRERTWSREPFIFSCVYSFSIIH